MKIRWMPQALRDLEAIRRFIARDSPAAARRWVARLQDRAGAAASAPLAGRVVPEFDRADVREVFLSSYRIVYRVIGGEMHVLTVFEGHRLMRRDGLPDEEQEKP
jgi:plasmid stabilization system protein ParE